MFLMMGQGNLKLDFLGGEGSYTRLLDCFEKAGLNLRAEIDAYFERFR
jgi:type II restriction enzyme